jgi:tetratricopeptide (TPR) repeat protein
MGKSPVSFNLIVELAHIKAFYLGKLSEAVSLLEDALTISKANNQQIALCKLELGDILLFMNDPWGSTLYYAQVEKMFSENPLGHEAKFRKAKLAYYTGNFKWAQAQLDILKASTSKLIANDAFELSSLISENNITDTTGVALSIFARADLLIDQKNDSMALLTLDSIRMLGDDHSLLDDILFRKAGIYKSRGDFLNAEKFYKELVDNYSFEILADNALFNLAVLYEINLNDKEKAKDCYNKLMFDYPGSFFLIDARKRFRILRGDKIKKSEEELFFKGVDG